MKKIFILLITFTLSLFILCKNDAHAYTMSNQARTYYNQTTASIGQADLLDISSNMIEYMYYDLGDNSIINGSTIRMVFSNLITTQPLPLLTTSAYNFITIELSFYTINNILIDTHISYYDASQTLSYFETNITPLQTNHELDYIVIRLSNLLPYDEEIAHQNMQGVIIMRGVNMIINQPITTTQYTNGWNDAMNSKVTQIWSLWGNIFDTFMGVFDIFSIQLVGDITIGHIALVPLVLGLIGFIYALGGKRGR